MSRSEVTGTARLQQQKVSPVSFAKASVSVSSTLSARSIDIGDNICMYC